MKRYKINYTFDPTMQCILGQFTGWQLVLDDYNNKYEYSKPFRQTKSNFNKLVKHIETYKIKEIEKQRKFIK